MRSRNLKPGFFKNPELLELGCEARLLFAGLWCMADKAGRLEDRPRKIKLELFPADSFEVEPLLEALEGQRLILRYSVDGAGFIQVVNFGKHQNPHKTEAESRIPPPPGCGESPLDNGSTTVNAALEHGSRPADSLIPDSPIPDSTSLRSERARRPARRCPEDFVIPADAVAAMRAECPTVDIQRETVKFRDHTFGAAKSDWLATWRNWIRKAAEMSVPRGTQPPGRASGIPDEREWTELRHRAEKIGFREPFEGERPGAYQTMLSRAEFEARKNRTDGPAGVAKLLERRA